MGAKQSALKKQVASLQAEVRKRSAKHQEELDTAAKEKRLLQVKINDLQAIVVQAQQEAEKSKSEAYEQEERMKALKWELVRQLKLTGSPASSPRASISPSASARIPLSWKLNEDVTLRQSAVSPTKESGNAGTSDNVPAPTPSTPGILLAPRRSLIARPDASVPGPNYTADVDAKSPSEPTSSSAPLDSKTSSGDPSPSELKHIESSIESPREFKTDSSSDDNRPPAKNDDEEEEKPQANPKVDNKHSEDEVHFDSS